MSGRLDATGARNESPRRWKPAPLKAACAMGLVLIALCVLPQAGNADMRSGGGQFVPAAELGSGHHYTGHQVAIRSAAPLQAGEGFDWADASVGAAFTVALGVLLAGGVLLLSRHRLHARVPAGSRH